MNEEENPFIKDNVKKKSKRKDVSERLHYNKELQVTVIKTSFNSFIKEQILIEPLEYILFQTNKIIFEAYNLSNFHIIRLINSNIITNIDQSFFYGCLSAIGNSSSKIKDLFFDKSVSLYKQLRPNNYNIPDSSYISSGILQNISLQMLTNTTNFIEMRFYRIFYKYIKHKYSKNGKDSYSILNHIVSEIYIGEDEIVLKYRKIVNDLLIKFSQERKNFFINPIIVFPILYMILKYNEEIHEKCKIEKRNVDKGVRLFSLIPTKKGFTYSHIKIDNSSLYGLLKHVEKYYKGKEELNYFNTLLKDNLIELESGLKFKKYEQDTWKIFFNIEKFEKKNKSSFKNEIVTDGKTVSITFSKKIKNKIFEKDKKIKKKNNLNEIHNLNLSDYENVLGLDPGRTSIFVATDTKGNIKEEKCKNYYNNAKFKETGRIEKGWVDRDHYIKSIIDRIPTNKSSNILKLEEYNKMVLINIEKLFEFYGAKRFRNGKFKRYIYSQKELRKMCSNITNNKKTLIGFGDWSANDIGGIIKKSQAGPVIKLKKMLNQYSKVIEIDEYKTSKVHNTCKCCSLENMYSNVLRNGSIERRKIHSVLFCKNKSCNGITMNRDKNASKNILEILLSEIEKKSRPICFSRSVKIDEVTSSLELENIISP